MKTYTIHIPIDWDSHAGQAENLDEYMKRVESMLPEGVTWEDCTITEDGKRIPANWFWKKN